MRNGKEDGLSIDYINLIASKVGLNIEYVNGFTWDQFIDKIYNKEIDIISSISSTPQRDVFLNFSNSYIHMPNVYYGRVGTAPINDIKDLEGKRIGVIEGWRTTETYKEDYPHLILIGQKSSTEALLAVSDGSIDIFIVPEPIGNYIIRQNFITGLKIVGNTFIPKRNDGASLQIGVRKDWKILNDIIKKADASLTKSEKQSLLEKWLFRNSATAKDKDNINLTDKERKWLQNNRVVKVAADPTAGPLELLDNNGEISGITGDYLKIISNKINLKFEWVGNKNWPEGLEKINNKQADMLSLITNTPDRNNIFNFTPPIISITNVIFSREGKKNMETWKPLEVIVLHR